MPQRVAISRNEVSESQCIVVRGVAPIESNYPRSVKEPFPDLLSILRLRINRSPIRLKLALFLLEKDIHGALKTRQ